MSFDFNLNGLSTAYNEAIKRKDFTFAFEIKYQKGHFIFFMFFSDKDKKSKDKLFLYLKNTNCMKQLKLYGSHSNGVFGIYFNEDLKQAIKDELGIVGGKSAFNLSDFFDKLNQKIPEHLSVQQKINVLRKYYPNLNLRNNLPNIVNEMEKIYWIGFMQLKSAKPRESTLRKLYIYTQCDAKQIDELLDILRAHNITLKWTSDQNKAKEADFTTMIEDLNNYKQQPNLT
ncbi:hypothetical protein [Gallibacterium sp. AGMB14963]|uniref:hypothetical protein n=1 Tax=Gallibacterium faecale TaxID=3019086 RepID=UPI0022F1999E|nr:hypothetical protein [Gallibacterium sp. AGMB14963]MDA3977578.1 hypothetical protein [Gallibacterium sp. AGMB14963]